MATVDGTGKEKDPFALAASLVEDPTSAPKLRRALGGVTRLSAFTATSVADGPEEPARPEIVHVVPDLLARRHHFDAILTTAGLVLHPIDGGLGYTVRRMIATQGMGTPVANAARRRFERLFALPADELLGAAPGAIVLRFADMRQLRKRRGWVVEIEVTGEAKPWRLRCPSKEDRNVLLGAMQQLLLGDVSGAGAAAA